MKPPAVARLLLVAVAGEQQAEFVTGDLHEEFLYLCQNSGRPAGRRWYAWQVLRSLAPLLAMRVRSGELVHLLWAAALLVTAPLLLLDRLWCFVYSQIPLKDGFERAPGLLAVNLLCVCAGAAVCGWLARNSHRAAATAAVTLAASAVALYAAVGAAPTLYVCLMLSATPAGSLGAFAWRRCR
jgi:hypothetical protein